MMGMPDRAGGELQGALWQERPSNNKAEGSTVGTPGWYLMVLCGLYAIQRL